MARIRTIKPDFWSDDIITECSLNARLLFIGTWNFADDKGNLDRSAKQIKARVFPLDNIDCEPLLKELISKGLLIEYSVSGKTYLHINGFEKHQVINRPSNPTCPPYPPNKAQSKDSVSPHVTLTSEGKGKEGNGEEGKDILVPSDEDDDCPHLEIIKLYHEHLPMLTRVVTWTPTRAKALRTRWREDKRRQNLDFWRRMFQYIAKSDFLTGKDGKWSADLEWIVKSQNFVKILEGKYENRES